MQLAIIVPCFNEAGNIFSFYQTLNRVPVEIAKVIFVDDGSSDNTREKIAQLNDPRVQCLAIRHCGKERALLHGINHALSAGTPLIATIDVDGQDPIELLPKLANAIKRGKCELAATRRRSRKNEPFLKRALAGTAYFLAPFICGISLVNGARDYCVMTRQVAQKIATLSNSKNLFLKGQIQAMQFKTHWLTFDYRSRKNGKSKWSFWQLLIYTLRGALVTRQQRKISRE